MLKYFILMLLELNSVRLSNVSYGEEDPGVGGEVDPQAEPHQQHLQRRSHNFLTDANRCSQQ